MKLISEIKDSKKKVVASLYFVLGTIKFGFLIFHKKIEELSV